MARAEDKKRQERDAERKRIDTRELTVRTEAVGEQAAQSLRWRVKRTMRELKEMADDEQIGLGLELIKAPLYGADWAVDCERDDIAEFIQTEIERLWRMLLRTSLRAVEFGFAPHEKLWELRNGEAHCAQIKDLDPEECVLLHDEQGEFAGFRYKDKVTVPAEKAFVFTHDKRFGNLYGVPRTRRVQTRWQWRTNVEKLMNRYAQRHSMPPIVGYAPAEKRVQEDSGTVVSTMEEMKKCLATLEAGGVVALPAEFGDDGKPLWTAELLTDKEQRAPDFIRMIEHYDTKILRGLLVPDRAGTDNDAAGGSYALVRSRVNLFLILEDQLLFDLLDHANRYLIPQLVLFNFGPDAPEAQLTSEGLGEEAKELLRQIVEKMLATEVTAATLAEIADTTAILEGAGVPVLDEDEQPDGDEKKKPKAKPKKTDPPEAEDEGEGGNLSLRNPAKGGHDPREAVAAGAAADAVSLFESLTDRVKKN